MSVLAPPLRGRPGRRQALVWYAILAVAGLAAVRGVAQLDWGLVWRVSPFLWKGLGVSFAMTGISIAAGLPLGIVLTAARLSGIKSMRWVAVGIIEVVRSTPQIMVIFWIYFTYPAVTGQSLSAWTGAAVALSLVAGAYLAEVVRGGLISIPAIQAESAEVMGLSRLQTFVFVLLPQACRNMIPAFIATLVMMFKTSSLVYVIGVVDLFRAVILVNSREFAPYTLYTVMALIYFACCYVMSRVIRYLDPKYST
jgi:His/Glu/Gln/Arg/opine family amino acid ABC transporter permease subunit